MRRSAALGITLLGALGGLPAAAQQAVRTYRVGFLIGRTFASSGLDEFRRSLSGLGYQEGKNLEIIRLSADGYSNRLPKLAAEMVRAKPDVIVAAGTALSFAKRATTTIPIVMTEQAIDPVGTGVVTSLARPGGNITGLTSMDAELSGKRLQLLMQLVPHLRRGAVVHDTNMVGASPLQYAESAAHAIGIQVIGVDIGSPGQLDTAMKTLRHLHVDSLIVPSDALTSGNLTSIVRYMAAQRLPAIYAERRFIAAGGLIYYAVSESAIWSQTATFVDRILRGAKPADLPVERPTVFDLGVNVKTARSLGITVPQSVLLQATEVIK